MVMNKAIEVTHRTLDAGEPVKWSGFGPPVARGRFMISAFLSSAKVVLP